MEEMSTVVVFSCICVASVIGLVFTVGLVVSNWVLRRNRLVKMSSPNLNMLMLMGGGLLYTTNIVYGIDSFIPHCKIGCRIWAWVLPIALTLLFGSLFAKSWRVNRIFSRPHQTKTVIRDYQLVLLVGVLLAVDVTVLTIWQVLDSSAAAKFEKIDQLAKKVQNSTLVTETHSAPTGKCFQNYAEIFVTIILLYKGALLVYGAYLAWAIRNVTIPPMDDSGCIFVSSHVTVISGSLAVAAMVLLKDKETARYASMASAVWLATTVTLLMEFLPKARYWLKHQNDNFFKMSLTPNAYNASIPATPYLKTTNVTMATNTMTSPCTVSSSCSSPAWQRIENEVSSNVDFSTSNPTSSDYQNSCIATLGLERAGVHRCIATPEKTHVAIVMQATPTTPVYNSSTNNSDSMSGSSPVGDSGNDSPRNNSAPETPVNRVYEYENGEQYRSQMTCSTSLELPYRKEKLRYTSSSSSCCHCTNGSEACRMDLKSHMYRRQMYYDYLRHNRRIVDRIAQTYDLETDDDTVTYISNCLTPSPSIASVANRSSRTGHHGNTHHHGYNPQNLGCLGNAWTLDSDSLYPNGSEKSSRTEETSERNGRRFRRKRRSHRNRQSCHPSSKSELNRRQSAVV